MRSAINTNKYLGPSWPDGVLVKYKTSNTESGVTSASFANYDKSEGFNSNGWVQLKVIRSGTYSSS